MTEALTRACPLCHLADEVERIIERHSAPARYLRPHEQDPRPAIQRAVDQAVDLMRSGPPPCEGCGLEDGELPRAMRQACLMLGIRPSRQDLLTATSSTRMLKA